LTQYHALQDFLDFGVNDFVQMSDDAVVFDELVGVVQKRALILHLHLVGKFVEFVYCVVVVADVGEVCNKRGEPPLHNVVVAHITLVVLVEELMEVDVAVRVIKLDECFVLLYFYVAHNGRVVLSGEHVVDFL